MPARRLIATTLVCAAAVSALSGCKTKGDIVVDEGVGITAIRSKCPAVGIPEYTGDMTLFGPGAGQTADNIDVVASMTDVRSTCDEASGADKVTTQVTFQVLARRNDVRGARTVTLPYSVSVLQGGTAVTSKRVGQVTLTFADGQDRAQATGSATAHVDRAAATLPDAIRERITRKRKAGDADAAVDPLADPEVKRAVAQASFEVLVGFQLTEAQLAYNATR